MTSSPSHLRLLPWAGPEGKPAHLVMDGTRRSCPVSPIRSRTAQAELGKVRDDWLSWAQRHHELRLDPPKAVLTIPAYFLNNQKHATRDACQIAGVEAVRLIHEPTAACITAARERR